MNYDIIEWSEFLYDTIIRHYIPAFLQNSSNDNLKTVISIDDEDYDIISGEISCLPKKLNNLIKRNIGKDNELKMKDFNFNLSITIMREDIYSLDYFNGYFTDIDSYYVDDVLMNGIIYLDIYLPEAILDIDLKYNDIDHLFNDYTIRKKLYEMISHEINHAYEFYQRTDSNKEIFPDRLLSFLIYINKENKFSDISNDWQNFLNLIYLHLSFEQNARVTQLYCGLRECVIIDLKDFLFHVEMSDVWNELIDLKNFNAKEFYDNFKIDHDVEEVKSVFLELGLYTKRDIKKNSIEKLVLKQLLSYWNNAVGLVNIEFEKLGDVKLEKLTPDMLEDPIKFLTYFEKRFHNNWNRFYKKICKMSTEFVD